jgi:hypothetical protein
LIHLDHEKGLKAATLHDTGDARSLVFCIVRKRRSVINGRLDKTSIVSPTSAPALRPVSLASPKFIAPGLGPAERVDAL